MNYKKGSYQNSNNSYLLSPWNQQQIKQEIEQTINNNVQQNDLACEVRKHFYGNSPRIYVLPHLSSVKRQIIPRQQLLSLKQQIKQQTIKKQKKVSNITRLTKHLSSEHKMHPHHRYSIVNNQEVQRIFNQSIRDNKLNCINMSVNIKDQKLEKINSAIYPHKSTALQPNIDAYKFNADGHASKQFQFSRKRSLTHLIKQLNYYGYKGSLKSKYSPWFMTSRKALHQTISPENERKIKLSQINTNIRNRNLLIHQRSFKKLAN